MIMSKFRCSWKKISILTILLLLLGITAIGYWYYQRLYPSTDDAYIYAHIVPIAAKVSGPITEIHIQNHQTVSLEEPLFEIDPAPFQAAVTKAREQLQMAEDTVKAQQIKVQASEALMHESQVELAAAEQHHQQLVQLAQEQTNDDDLNTARLNSAQAALAASQYQLREEQETLNGQSPAIAIAKAKLDQVLLDSKYTHMLAPATGTLVNVNFHIGEVVYKNETLFTLIEDNKWWIDADFKPSALQRIRVGQQATIEVAQYPQHKFHGIVTSVNPADKPAVSLLPAKNTDDQWQKITQKFTVRIEIIDVNSNYPLRIGTQANVTINTRE